MEHLDEVKSGYMPDIDEVDDILKEINKQKNNLLKRRSIKFRDENFFNKCCGCIQKNYDGRRCECIAIKEDIRILLTAGEFMDKIIIGQQKAIESPVKHIKLYELLDGVLQMDGKCFACSCEPEEDTSNLINGKLIQNRRALSPCDCPDLLKKRGILRTIRNNLNHKMKIVRRHHFILLKRNNKKKAIMKKLHEKLYPAHTTRSIKYSERKNSLIRRCKILMKMNEADVLNNCECLLEKKKLFDYIGEHKVLPNGLRRMLIIDELAINICEKQNKENDKAMLELIRKAKKPKKFKCKCKENDRKIEILENFINLLSQLHPVIKEKEESFDSSDDEPKTIKELIIESNKNQFTFLDKLREEHKNFIQELYEQNELLEENNMITELIQMLEVQLKLKQPYEELEENGETNEVELEENKKCKEEVKLLEKLLAMLHKYLIMNKDKEDEDRVVLLLSDLNEMLEDYLKIQKKLFRDLANAFPDFNMALFTDERQKNKMIREICKNDKYGLREYVEKSDNDDERVRLRQLLTLLTRPEFKTGRDSQCVKDTKNVGERRNEFEGVKYSRYRGRRLKKRGDEFRIRNILNKIKKFKMKVMNKLKAAQPKKEISDESKPEVVPTNKSSDFLREARIIMQCLHDALEYAYNEQGKDLTKIEYNLGREAEIIMDHLYSFEYLSSMIEKEESNFDGKGILSCTIQDINDDEILRDEVNFIKERIARASNINPQKKNNEEILSEKELLFEADTIMKHLFIFQDLYSRREKGLDVDDSLKNKNPVESARLKNLARAFREGNKIASKQDPLIIKQENLYNRKRLLHELELEKGLKVRKCGLKKQEEIKNQLKRAYESERTEKCRCVKTKKQLSILKKEVENIIFHPEEYRINFLSGPLLPAEKEAREKTKKFLSEVLRPKKKKKREVLGIGIGPLMDQGTKTSLTVYNGHRFDIVWSKSQLAGLFFMNLEAQMMENERIIIRPQYGNRVKVMSGGRMGLEPLFGEYVSVGMLDAVVLGTAKDPPIPRVILQAIVELNTGEGVIIIILNEYSNRLNFVFAIERARKLGIDVQLVLARDDIADQQPEELKFGRRGHAGIVLQYKIAAGMAMKGHNLAAISRVTQNIQIATLACHLLGCASYIGPGISTGLGDYVPALQAVDIIKEIFRQLIDRGSHRSLGFEPDTNVVILLNMFMITTDEAYSIVSIIVKLLLDIGAKIGRIYHGSFTYFQRQGFSITLLKDWNDELIQFLDLPTKCSLWPPHLSGNVDTKMPKTQLYTKYYLGSRNPPENMKVLYDIMDRILRDAKVSIKKLSVLKIDVSKGMLKTFLTIRPELDLHTLPLTRPFLLLKFIAKVLRENFKSLGKLFGIFLLAAAQEFLRNEDCIVDWRNWCMALKKGTQALQGYTKFKVGQGTIVDFLEPISEALYKTKEGWSPLPNFYGGLEKLKDVMMEKKNDVEFIILDFIFKNIYDCLFEHMSHYKGEEWWKLKPPTTIVLVDPYDTNKVCYHEIPTDLKEKIREKENELLPYTPRESTGSEGWKRERGSEPSIEATPLQDIEGECVSLRSADEALLRQPFLQHRSDDDDIELESEFDEATTGNQDGGEGDIGNYENLSVEGPHEAI